MSWSEGLPGVSVDRSRAVGGGGVEELGVGQEGDPAGPQRPVLRSWDFTLRN